MDLPAASPPTLPRSSWRVPLTRRPWQSLAYLLRGAGSGFLWLPLISALVFVGLVLLPIGIGSSILLYVVRLGSRYSARDRRRLGVEEPLHNRPVPRLQERATWSEFGYLLLSVSVVWVGELVVTAVPLFAIGTLLTAPVLVLVLGDQLVVGGPPLQNEPIWPYLPLVGVGVFVVFTYVWIGGARACACLARAMIGISGSRLDDQLVEVAKSRARLLDAFEVERRRIERDLHDGAQQRLVSLTMTLGLARMHLDEHSDASTATRLVADAQREAGHVLTELRELIRGIHPQVLTDRGLVPAIEELADRSTIDVRTNIQLTGRPAGRIETTVYFIVSEALSNAIKHGGADQADIMGEVVDDTLVVEIRDDGRGGADPSAGTGLQGLADRVAAVDGKLLLASPDGGPTMLRVEIPWTTAH